MKWLALFLSVLALAAVADDETPNDAQVPSMIAVPTAMQCGPVVPDSALKEVWGEEGFVVGNAKIYGGDMVERSGLMRMYVSTEGEPRTFTIMLQITDELNCMLVTGTRLEPYHWHEPKDAL